MEAADGGDPCAFLNLSKRKAALEEDPNDFLKPSSKHLVLEVGLAAHYIIGPSLMTACIQSKCVRRCFKIMGLYTVVYNRNAYVGFFFILAKRRFFVRTFF